MLRAAFYGAVLFSSPPLGKAGGRAAVLIGPIYPRHKDDRTQTEFAANAWPGAARSRVRIPASSALLLLLFSAHHDDDDGRQGGSFSRCYYYEAIDRKTKAAPAALAPNKNNKAKDNRDKNNDEKEKDENERLASIPIGRCNRPAVVTRGRVEAT